MQIAEWPAEQSKAEQSTLLVIKLTGREKLYFPNWSDRPETNLAGMFYISNIVISTIKYQCKARN